MILKRVLFWLYVFSILGAATFYATQLYGLYLRVEFDRVERVYIAGGEK